MTNPQSWRQGFCDGLLGRDSKNPYDWQRPISMANYNNGFWIGKQRRIKDHIILKVEAI